MGPAHQPAVLATASAPQASLRLSERQLLLLRQVTRWLASPRQPPRCRQQLLRQGWPVAPGWLPLCLQRQLLPGWLSPWLVPHPKLALHQLHAAPRWRLPLLPRLARLHQLV